MSPNATIMTTERLVQPPRRSVELSFDFVQIDHQIIVGISVASDATESLGEFFER